MNKTVNINLANTFFHIDEEAYTKLRRYLEAIKRSFAGTAGSEEIIMDIEARIAELFSEKMEHDRQVITQKEVDHVINIMGQPEDYMVDEDIFEDTPKTHTEKPRKGKKLYRDIDQKYISGVCAGLEHYLGVDSLWIRLAFIFLALVTSGFWILIYIILWILVPEAASTSQKLDMRGEPVNISNIERKVKEGFVDVADKVKSVDYQKVGNQVKSSSKTFFDTIADIFMFIFKIFGKFIGILMIITGAAALIGLFISMFTIGIIKSVNIPGVDFYNMVNTTGTPIWLVSLLVFFAIGIPFFFLLYLGLKILVSNLKSIGNVAKYTLFGVWLIATACLVYLGIKQSMAYAYTGTTTETRVLPINKSNDTLYISTRSAQDLDFENSMRYEGLELVFSDDGEPIIYSKNIRLDVKKATDTLTQIKIKRDADGSSFEEARARAEKIAFDYQLDKNQFIINNYLTTPKEAKMRNQEVRAELFVPVGTVVIFAENLDRHIGWSTKNNKDFYRSEIVDYHWVMGNDGILECLNCPEDPETDEQGKINISESGIDINVGDENGHVKIGENGIDIDVKDGSESVILKIDENGVQLKAKDNN
ncbi:PspC domain-containing protein [Flavobacterium sp. ASW18X]|uniref:PspC domain-containing protein n=1 Tax=Flavobacterium sp. ASW18X TaxID=2572595 RepID=UPI0010AE36F3|nr:PspC domain-containing protein [Flavobacterium sp. ASW18X]TKD62546.1 PspC domain-containing protein [Flavobacterium sp. ASW18X]